MGGWKTTREMAPVYIALRVGVMSWPGHDEEEREVLNEVTCGAESIRGVSELDRSGCVVFQS